ncbi:hypothetical protein Tco_0264598 [Tanacetum coccineum]
MRAFICDFQTTNELLFKERNNSLIELRFVVQELLKVTNNDPMTDCEVKGVTTRGRKTATQVVQDNNTNIHTEEPLVVNHDKLIESNEVLTEDQPKKTNKPVDQPSSERIELIQTSSSSTTNGVAAQLPIPSLVTTEEKAQKKNDVKARRTASSSSSSSSQNMAFVSSPSSTNKVNTTNGVSTANTQVSPASTQVSTIVTNTQVSTANLSDDNVYAFLVSQPNGSQLVYEDLEQIHEDDIEEMDLKWQLALLSIRTRSYMTDDEVPTYMALMAFSDSEELVSDDKLEKKTIFPTVAKIEFVRPKQQEKPVRKPVKYAKTYRSKSPRGNQRSWNNQKSQQLGSDFVMYNKACFICGSFDM